MKDLIEIFVLSLTHAAAADPFFADMPDQRPTYGVEFGRKYARIVSNPGTSHASAWGFIEILTGDILKANGWKGPAKHARGNIGTSQYGRGYTWTGPAYLR